ncbi:MAG: SecDF P1 head subdomain-containing protein [Oscillospiraceae bacterium]
MKKIFSAVLAAVLLCGCADNSGIFREEKSDISTISETEKLPEANAEDFEFTEIDSGVVVTKYLGSQTEFSVPEKIAGKPVVEIGNKAFCGRADLTRVALPDTVAKISKSDALKFREGEDISGDVILTGADIEKVNVYYNEYDSQYNIGIEFTPSGAEKFAEATKRLIGEVISIWVDDELLSAPYVHEQITDGMAQIAGNFSFEEVQEYVAKINGNPFQDCEKIRVTYKGKTYGYDELNELYSAVN